MTSMLIQTCRLQMLLMLCAGLPAAASEYALWYDEPAVSWEKEALPVGNGRLGAMVFGGISSEHFQFNEDTLWIGDEEDTGAYQKFGDVFVELHAATGDTGAEDYRRCLDIRSGVHEVSYRLGEVTFRRTMFCSQPDQVVVLRLTADRSAAYTGRLRLEDAHGAATTIRENRITASGNLQGFVYSDGSGKGRTQPYDFFLDYEAQLLLLPTGGSVRVEGNSLVFSKCDELVILLAAGTDYLNRRDRGWKGPHPHEQVSGQLAAAAGKPFDQLLAAHMADYRGLFDRCQIELGRTADDLLAKSTDERLEACRKGRRDPDLEELLFQYARYLMISSSRPGSLPANLQGLWNDSNHPPWRSDYHTDVNIQMNYWFVDAANLAECFQPLAEWVHSIRGVRRDETRAALGTRGWICHAENGPFGGSTWEWSKGDAAWLAQNLYDHYAFTGDRRYLEERLYPVLQELCEFWVDHLKELDDGTLVSPDGFSPEHGPREDGVSFDQQLVYDLFTNYGEAADILDRDKAFRETVAAMRGKLLGPQIGRWGQLQEWMVDRDDPQDRHRHISHMIAVHPGRQISPLTTPELAEAARVSLNARGDASTGWSRAWKISIWARLHDGNRAYHILNGMMREMIYPNLFNTHPPFQIDGNFGYAAGVCEMLLQSQLGELHLLPALPEAWPDGSVRGMRARGGYTVDLNWKGGALAAAWVRADRSGPCRIRYGGNVRTVELQAGVRTDLGVSIDPG